MQKFGLKESYFWLVDIVYCLACMSELGVEQNTGRRNTSLLFVFSFITKGDLHIEGS